MADVRSGIAAEPVSDVVAVLGEGPYWVADDDCLFWVDVRQALLHRTDAVTGATETTQLEEVSAVFPALDGGVLVSGGRRLTHHYPTEDGTGWVSRVVAEAPARDEVRFNDAKVDPAGRVWVGSMHAGESEPLGELYRLDAGGVLTPVVKGVTVSNGIGWSPEGTRMYYVDSPARRIDTFDYDPATGEAARRRVLSDLTRYDGVPDGLTVDADGCVWVAMWGGGVLRRFAPEGSQDAVVEVPVSRPTSCAFGGPGMTELYVTTARVDMSDADREREPLAGRLLRLVPGPVGLPSTATEAVIPA